VIKTALTYGFVAIAALWVAFHAIRGSLIFAGILIVVAVLAFAKAGSVFGLARSNTKHLK
jgi:hypothetical protein